LAQETTVEDAELVYAAIRAAGPGGIGKVEDADVSSMPSITLHEAMKLAADRDLVAKQYTNDFADVRAVAEQIAETNRQGFSLSDSIVRAHVWQMARCPDSLIARKCGPEVARQSADRAGAVFDSGAPASEEYGQALADLDFWLRSDGHRRNPGTTADLIAAAIFVLLAEDRVACPVRFY
jgi:triphosphoribosyl-dephospho-CoA synthase